MSAGVLNVIRCKDTRRMMRNALAAGWEWVGYTKAGHVEIVWPPTDTHVWCGSSPSDRNAWKRFAREVQSISGIDPRVKPNITKRKARG